MPVISLSKKLVERERLHSEQFLRSIAQNESVQLQDWIKERHGGALLISNNAVLTDFLYQHTQENENIEAKNNVISMLKNIQLVYGYESVQLVDKKGQVILSAAEESPLGDFG